MPGRKESPTDIDDFEVLQCCDLEDFLRLLDLDPKDHEVDSAIMNAARSMYAAPLPPGWSEQIDEGSAYLYFYHKITGESIWLHPQEALFKELIREVNEWKVNDPQDVIAGRIERHMKKAQKDAADVISQWSCAEIPEDGSGGQTQYYVNTITGETSWADPRSSLEFDLWQRQYVLNTTQSAHVERLKKPKLKLKPKPPPAELEYKPWTLEDRQASRNLGSPHQQPQLTLTGSILQMQQEAHHQIQPVMQPQEPSFGSGFQQGLTSAGWVTGFAAGLASVGVTNPALYAMASELPQSLAQAMPLGAQMMPHMGAMGFNLSRDVGPFGAGDQDDATQNDDEIRNLGTAGLPTPSRACSSKEWSSEAPSVFGCTAAGSMTPLSSRASTTWPEANPGPSLAATTKSWAEASKHVAGVKGFGPGGLPTIELPSISAFPPPLASVRAVPPSTVNRWFAHARYVNSQLKSDNFELALLTLQIKKLNGKCVELDLKYEDRFSLSVERREMWTSMRAQYETLRCKSQLALAKPVEILELPTA